MKLKINGINPEIKVGTFLSNGPAIKRFFSTSKNVFHRFNLAGKIYIYLIALVFISTTIIGAKYAYTSFEKNILPTSNGHTNTSPSKKANTNNINSVSTGTSKSTSNSSSAVKSTVKSSASKSESTVSTSTAHTNLSGVGSGSSSISGSIVSSRPSGLIQAGNSKTNCIYTGSSGWAAQLTSAEQTTGFNYNCVETFSDADPAWSDWVSPWVTTSYGFAQWLAVNPSQRIIILTQNLVPDSVANSDPPLVWEQACAAGDYNSYATQLGENLVSTGFENSVIRLGHEMNGNWYNDSLNGTGSASGITTAEETAWGQCFAQEVTAMRAVPGSDFLFDWNVNASVASVPLASFYPGNAYVDIIGVDQYDAWPDGSKPSTSASEFQSLLSYPYSLTDTNDIIAFAKSQGKPISIPEWGLVPASGGGLGDDPYYVSGIASLVANNNVAYQSYFDSNSAGISPLGSSIPNATAEYIQSF